MGRNSFKVIIAAIAIFLLVGAAYGQPVDPIQRRDNTWYGNNYFTKSIVERVTIANLPSNDSTNPGNLRWVTDSSNDDCVTDGGSTLVMCYDDGTQWRPVGVNATVPTWSQVMGVGNSYFSADSPTNGAQIGTSGSYILIYDDVTDGPKVICVIGGVAGNCDRNFKLNSGYKFQISDSSGNPVWRLTESTGLVTYPTSSKAPKKSVGIPAGALSSDGTNCADPAEVTINSGPKLFTVICTDNDASTVYATIPMPDSWDGGTITLEGQFIQTAADTSALHADVAGQCRGSGDTVNSTWGTEIAMDITNMTGSNAIDHVTTAAITPNGTCAAGDTLWLRWQMDATGTTTAVATLHIVGFKMEYSVSGNSD